MGIWVLFTMSNENGSSGLPSLYALTKVGGYSSLALLFIYLKLFDVVTPTGRRQKSVRFYLLPTGYGFKFLLPMHNDRFRAAVRQRARDLDEIWVRRGKLVACVRAVLKCVAKYLWVLLLDSGYFSIHFRRNVGSWKYSTLDSQPYGPCELWTGFVV